MSLKKSANRPSTFKTDDAGQSKPSKTGSPDVIDLATGSRVVDVHVYSGQLSHARSSLDFLRWVRGAEQEQSDGSTELDWTADPYAARNQESNMLLLGRSVRQSIYYMVH